MSGRLLAVLATSALAFTVTAKAEGDPRAKISAKLLGELAEKGGDHDVIVMLEGKADLTKAALAGSKAQRTRQVRDALRHAAQAAQAALRAELAAKKLSFRPYYVANAIAVYDLSATEVEALAARKDVQRVVSNAAFRAVSAPRAMQLVDDHQKLAIGDNIVQTGASRVWSELGKKGEGLVIGGQDTGIDWDHPGLVNQYRGKSASGVSHDYNWHDAVHAPLAAGLASNPCGYDTREPCDDNGHGTHTIGTAVGGDGSGNQVGMAPRAKWIGCRNMDAGIGTPSTYLECFQFFLAPWPYGGDPETDGKPEMAPDVTNNSWGCPTSEGCEGAEFVKVLEAFKAAGIMTVAAAGNAGSSCSTIEDAPAHHSDEVLVVGAVDHRNRSVASFSSRGPSRYDGKVSPDLTAPGVSVRSTVPGGGYQGSQWSGTSMASPHVAGAVALLWSARPELKGQIDATVERLRATAERRSSSQSCGGTPGSAVPNNTFGYGILNVYAAATAP
jgi:subtilisin family serine protease